MIKSSTISFDIRMDIQGIKQILSYIEDGTRHLEVIYLGKSRRFEIELDAQDDRIVITGDAIKIYMDDEEIDYLKYKLEEALVSKSFFPAEICERNYKNRNTTLCCIILK